MQAVSARLAGNGIDYEVVFDDDATGTAEGGTITVGGVGQTTNNDALAGDRLVGQLDTPVTDPTAAVRWSYDPSIGNILNHDGEIELDETIDLVVTNNVPAPLPTTIAKTTIRDEHGQGLADAVLQYRMVAGPGTAANAHTRRTRNATAAANGAIEVELIQGASYQFRYEGGPWTTAAEAPATEEWPLDEILGGTD